MAAAVAALAEKFGASVTVLNAFNLVHEYRLDPARGVPDEAEPNTVPYVPALQELRDVRAQRLEQFARTRFSGIEYKTTIVDGEPATAIEWAAKHEAADLVALSTRGRGRFRRMLLGSITAKVLHDVECPVLTSAHEPGTLAASPDGCRSILCAVRLDPESEATLQMAALLARAYGARVCALHLVSPGESGDENASAQFVRRAFEQALGPGGSAKVEICVRILDTDLPDCIRQTALDEAADLVVVGRGHARGSVSRVWSHLYAVIRESPCPVLSV